MTIIATNQITTMSAHRPVDGSAGMKPAYESRSHAYDTVPVIANATDNAM